MTIVEQSRLVKDNLVGRGEARNEIGVTRSHKTTVVCAHRAIYNWSSDFVADVPPTLTVYRNFIFIHECIARVSDSELIETLSWNAIVLINEKNIRYVL